MLIIKVDLHPVGIAFSYVRMGQGGLFSGIGCDIGSGSRRRGGLTAFLLG